MKRSFRRAIFALAAIAAISPSPARAETPDYSRVISSVTLSFEAGDTDRAVLVENDDAGADLYIYRALEPSPAAPPKPALVKKNAAWSGAMWGTRPSLELSGKGSLLVKSGNDAIGRGRWSQTLSIVYRGNEFIVAGLTREARDTIDLTSHACDLNFLSGKGMRDGKAVALKTPAPKLADWSDEKLPEACAF